MSIFQVAEDGDLLALKRLIEEAESDGADIKLLVDSQNPISGISPMHIASRRNFLDICQFLYEYGASVDITDTEDKTPLHYAARAGHIDICTFLLDSGAELDAKDRVFLFFCLICFLSFFFITFHFVC